MKGNLNAPMTNEMHAQLEKMLQAEDTKCKDLAEVTLVKARTEDISKSKDYSDEQVVIDFRKTLMFFKKYDLFESASQQADMFDNYIVQQTQRINEAKDFRNLSLVGQLIMESTQIIFQRFHQKDKTRQLVSEMIKLQKKIQELEQD